VELARIRGALVGVEARLGIDLANLKYEDLLGLVKRAEQESDQVDFKREVNHDKPNDLARDIASMANHLGGLIFIGIDEADETGVRSSRPAAGSLRPVASTVGSEHIVDWVTRAIAHHVVPRIEIGTAWIDNPSETDTGFLVLGVVRSDQRPHGVDLRDGKFLFQRRRGTSNGPLTEAELAATYRERGTARQDRHELLERRTSEYSENTLIAEPAVSVTTSIVPEIPGEWLIHDDAFEETRQWMRELEVPDARLFKRKFTADSDAIAVARRGSVKIASVRSGTQFFADGSTVSQNLIFAQPPSRNHGEPPYCIQELQLMGAINQSIRMGAAHALTRAVTFGRAFVGVEISACDEVALRGWRLEGRRISSLQIGGPLPRRPHELNESELVLDQVFNGERAASHAAWFILKEFYQAYLGETSSTLMGYDGRYRLAELGDLGLFLRRVEVSPSKHQLLDINDEIFATVRQSGDSSCSVEIGSSSHSAGSIDDAVRKAEELLRSERYEQQRGR
jgi:Putative DNA-binding domain